MSRTNDNPQNQSPERAPLREITKEELDNIVKNHCQWITTGQRLIGKKAELKYCKLDGADFRNCDLSAADFLGSSLRGANFSGAQLQQANFNETDLRGAYFQNTDKIVNMTSAQFIKADLRGAHLQSASLQEANLSHSKLQDTNLQGARLDNAILVEANLQRANLTRAALVSANLLRATLREADLQDAELDNAKGLSEGQLAGANLSGASLPNNVSRFEGLAYVEEISRKAQKLFVSILLGSVYSWLTIANTTDAQLLTNSSSTPLPNIGTPIPVVLFYWAGPALLVGLYFYFHLYLQRLWEGLANLPAIFPDGRTLDRKAHPWLLNGLVLAYFVRLRGNRPPLSRLQNCFSVLLAWWIVPCTLLLFWIRFLPRHDWGGTILHVLLIVVSIWAGLILNRLAVKTLRGIDRKTYNWREALHDDRTYKRSAIALGTLGIGAFFSLISLGAIEGVHFWPELEEGGSPYNVRYWAPRALALLGRSPFAELDEVELSIKPVSWKEGNTSDEIKLVKGARLRARNLRSATADGAFLVRAQLQFAVLDFAHLSGADLREADLRWATLKGAWLTETNLRNSNLRGTDCRRAIFIEADLQGSDLQQANLSEAILTKANLKSANLSEVRGLTRNQIELAYTDNTTVLPGYLLQPPAKANQKAK